MRKQSQQTKIDGSLTVELTFNRAIARQNPNYKEGRPKKYTAIQLQHAMELLERGKTYREVEAMTGISKSTLIRVRKKS